MNRQQRRKQQKDPLLITKDMVFKHLDNLSEATTETAKAWEQKVIPLETIKKFFEVGVFKFKTAEFKDLENVLNGILDGIYNSLKEQADIYEKDCVPISVFENEIEKNKNSFAQGFLSTLEKEK